MQDVPFNDKSAFYLKTGILFPDDLNTTVVSQGCLLEVTPNVETGQNAPQIMFYLNFM